MRAWLRRQAVEYREAFEVLASRRFWRDFAYFWSPDEIAGRLDLWTQAVRRNLGKRPDSRLNERIRRRREAGK